MDMTSDLSLQESCMAALRHMGVEVRALVGKTNELEAENAKLRELVKDMWGAYCFGNGGCGDTWLTGEQDMAVRQRVLELGIEVDDD